jgi:hypothetical protein
VTGLAEILPGLCESGLHGASRPGRGITEFMFGTNFDKCVFDKRARAIYSTSSVKSGTRQPCMTPLSASDASYNLALKGQL